MRRSRPDSSPREEQHGEAEQVEPAAGSGVVSNGGDSSAWCGGRLRERRRRDGALGLGFQGGEQGESSAPGHSIYPPGGERGGPAARRSGELDTAASGSDATVSDRDDGNFAITPLAPFLLLCFYFLK